MFQTSCKHCYDVLQCHFLDMLEACLLRVALVERTCVRSGDSIKYRTCKAARARRAVSTVT